MEQSPDPSVNAPKPSFTVPSKNNEPSNQQLNDHYKSEGPIKKEHLMEVVKDLHKISFFTMNPERYGFKDAPVDEYIALALQKHNKAVARVAFMETKLEMRMESQPGYGEILAIGVASGAIWSGIESVFPHVVAEIGQIWNAVWGSTKS